jgi:hypothetical protein
MPPLSYDGRSYDDRQLAARLVTWLCCRRTVYAVDPDRGCFTCEEKA